MDKIPRYYTKAVLWELLPGKDANEKRTYLKQLENAAKEWPKSWYQDMSLLWHDIAKSECIEYFLYLLAQRSYHIDSLGEKTHAIFDNLLENFAVAQIFNLSWQAVRDTTDFIVKERIGRTHGKNIFIGNIQRKADKALAEGWEIRASRRDFNCPQTAISATFFNVFLACIFHAASKN